MEISPHIGLSCPVCNRGIPESRLRSPRCACGWRQRSNPAPWIVLGSIALACAVYVGLSRPTPKPADGVSATLSLVPPPQAPSQQAHPTDPPLQVTQFEPDIRMATAPPTPKPPPGAQDLMAQARELAARGDLEAAADLYRKSILLAPSVVETHLELGLLCSDLGDMPCARSALSQALLLDPRNAEVLQQMASIFGAAGDVDGAVDALRRWTKLDPDNPRPAMELARTLDQADRKKEAIAAYREFTDRFPRDSQAAAARSRFEELVHADQSSKRGRRMTVPIRRSGSAILIDGGVEDSGDVRFLLDTGSTLTIISTELAQELGFNLRDPGLRHARLETANGPVEAPLVLLESVRLGRVVAHNVQAAVFDINAVDPIDGLLGLSFLDQFRFTIDAKASVMHLEPRP